MFDVNTGISPLLLELRNAAGEGLTQAGMQLAVDFINRNYSDWRYYAGVAAGATVLATGSPTASIAFWATAEALDLLVFKSPDGEGFDLFVDGVAQGSITTQVVNEVWETIRVQFGGPAARRKVEIRNKPDTNGDQQSWLAIGGIVPFTDTGGDTTPGVGTPDVLEQRTAFEEGKPWQVTLTLKGKRASEVSFYLPYFYTADLVSEFAYTVAMTLQYTTDAPVVSATATRPLRLDYGDPPPLMPLGMGANQPGSSPVQRRLKLRLHGRDRADRALISIPAWRDGLTIPVGDGKVIADFTQENVAALLDALLRPSYMSPDFLAGVCDARGVALIAHDMPYVVFTSK